MSEVSTERLGFCECSLSTQDVKGVSEQSILRFTQTTPITKYRLPAPVVSAAFPEQPRGASAPETAPRTVPLPKSRCGGS
jgi:hypothetical protein